MRKVVLTTIGTLGDLHPFIAIGLALRKRGFTPVLAVPEDQVAKCRRAGLEAVAILPQLFMLQRTKEGEAFTLLWIFCKCMHTHTATP